MFALLISVKAGKEHMKSIMIPGFPPSWIPYWMISSLINFESV